MARTDWAALLTEPAAEYLAHTELQRFGLDPYLPQLRKRHHTQSGKLLTRRYPLFPRYLLIHINDAYSPAIRMARGVCRHRPILANENGQPWRAPGPLIDAIRASESGGDFDQILHKGDAVTFAYGVLATLQSTSTISALAPGVIELLTPLLGGARAKTDPSHIAAT
jgi:hypothetical protein